MRSLGHRKKGRGSVTCPYSEEAERLRAALEAFWEELADESDSFYHVVNTDEAYDDQCIEWWMPIGPFRRLYKATHEAENDNLP